MTAKNWRHSLLKKEKKKIRQDGLVLVDLEEFCLGSVVGSAGWGDEEEEECVAIDR